MVSVAVGSFNVFSSHSQGRLNELALHHQTAFPPQTVTEREKMRDTEDGEDDV